MIDIIMDRIARLVEETGGGRSIDPPGSITLATLRKDLETLAAKPEPEKRPPGRPKGSANKPK